MRWHEQERVLNRFRTHNGHVLWQADAVLRRAAQPQPGMRMSSKAKSSRNQAQLAPDT